METTRELDQIRAELDKLHERSTAAKVTVTALEAMTEVRFNHILSCLESMKADIETLTGSVNNLQKLASDGKTSLNTLLWVGGTLAGFISLVAMVYDIIPK